MTSTVTSTSPLLALCAAATSSVAVVDCVPSPPRTRGERLLRILRRAIRPWPNASATPTLAALDEAGVPSFHR